MKNQSRKSKAEKKVWHTLSTTVYPSVYRDIKTLADERQWSISQMTRSLIDAGLKSNKR